MNIPTIITLSILGVVVAIIIAVYVINRKKGKGGCSCGCGGCANRDFCHPTENKEN